MPQDMPPVPPDYDDIDIMITDEGAPWVDEGVPAEESAPVEDDSEWGRALDMAWVLGLELSEGVEPDGRPTLSELGNARRLVQMHGEDIRHCGSLAGTGWLTWDGRRWCPDATGQVDRMAKRLPDVLRAEAEDLAAQAKGLVDSEDEDEQARGKALMAASKARRMWAQRCESARTIGATLSLLKTESTVPVRVDQLDADPWLLCTPTGVVDLRGGDLLDPARDYLLTRLTGVGYDPAAPCPVWERFLLDIMGESTELVGYLQRAVGYSLVGSTAEQVMFICHGSGANGKSTFLETLRHVLGDYAANCPADSFVGRKEGSIPNDLARLTGARFVTASETAENRYLDEALVKALTGGEPVTARFLNREFFEFEPQFSVWMATNHKPRVRGTDHGIWRRLHLVPFLVTIDPGRMDRTLPARLQEEGPGILRWAVDGLLEWLDRGLDPPQAVLSATQDYRSEEDRIAAFLDECCTLGEHETTASGDLYAAYVAWAKTAGEFVRSQKWLGAQLKARGLEMHRTKSARLWKGIRVDAAPTASGGKW